MATAKLGGDVGAALPVLRPLSPRRAAESDLPAIAGLWLETIRTSNTARDIEEAYREHGRYFLTLEEEGRLAGFVAGTVKNRTRGHISGIAVRPDCRRRGFGRTLMRAAEEAFRADGFTRLTLEVRPSNREALKFYEALGYRRLHIVPGYYFDGEDALLCEKNLLRPG